MGVVQRQGIKQSAVNLIGIIIGAINVMIIYPMVFRDPEGLGLIRIITGFVVLVVPFALLGHASIPIRFFPQLKDDKNNHNGFLSYLIGVTLIGFLFAFSLIYLFKSSIIDFYSQKSNLFGDFFWVIAPIVLFQTLFSILTQYIANFFRIVIPALLIQFIKVWTMVSVLLFYFDYISYASIIHSLLFYYLFITLGLFFYLYRLGQLKFTYPSPKILNKPKQKEIWTYATYGTLGSIGGVLATQIDVLMVGSLNSYANAGVYSIGLFIANVIIIPYGGFAKITEPIISESWKTGNTAKIKEIYQELSRDLLIFGIFIFIGIWASIDHLFELMPNGDVYQSAKYVVFILGISKLFDMAASVNGQIIAHSKFFRFNFYAILCLAVLNIITNLQLIPLFEMEGAALATFISVFLFNIVKMGFIYFKLNMQPFTVKTLYIVLIAAFAYLAATSFQLSESPILNILLKSSIITLIYIGSVYYFNISNNFNKIITQAISKIISKKN